jgi:serine/threonine protein kinase
MESNNIQESIGGRYIILKERGSGKTSEVFKVQDNNTQKIYAAKVYKTQSPFFPKRNKHANSP